MGKVLIAVAALAIGPFAGASVAQAAGGGIHIALLAPSPTSDSTATGAAPYPTRPPEGGSNAATARGPDATNTGKVTPLGVKAGKTATKPKKTSQPR